MSPAVPYWRLSAFYLFYFGALGALVPYWSLYLHGRGYGPEAIGAAFAVMAATKVVAPNVWGWLGDRSGHRLAIVRLGSLGAFLAFCGIFLVEGHAGLLLVVAGFSFFWNAVLPQMEATTMSHLGPESHRYASVRLWGSVGFILAVAGLGPVLERAGSGVVPWAVAGSLAGIWLASLAVPEAPGPRAAGPGGHASLAAVLRRREVAGLLAVCFLMQASHGPYYAFYTLHMETAGHARSVIGGLWALGVVAEIGVFLVMHRWLPRFGARDLLLAALALTAVRWVAVALWPGSLPAMAAAQTLHAASFGIYHAAAIHLVHAWFRGPHQGRGQALYSSVSFGAGGAAGSLAAGLAWEEAGGAATYLAAAAVAALALAVAAATLPARAARAGRAGAATGL